MHHEGYRIYTNRLKPGAFTMSISGPNYSFHADKPYTSKEVAQQEAVEVIDKHIAKMKKETKINVLTVLSAALTLASEKGDSGLYYRAKEAEKKLRKFDEADIPNNLRLSAKDAYEDIGKKKYSSEVMLFLKDAITVVEEKEMETDLSDITLEESEGGYKESAIVNFVKRNINPNNFSADENMRLLELVKAKFGGEIVNTGGGFMVLLIRLNANQVIGINNEYVNKYTEKDSKDPSKLSSLDIFDKPENSEPENVEILLDIANMSGEEKERLGEPSDEEKEEGYREHQEFVLNERKIKLEERIKDIIEMTKRVIEGNQSEPDIEKRYSFATGAMLGAFEVISNEIKYENFSIKISK